MVTKRVEGGTGIATSLGSHHRDPRLAVGPERDQSLIGFYRSTKEQNKAPFTHGIWFTRLLP